ncbi:menaquinone-dependent protoporphyrinogen IX dehydrogenase [Formosa sediminum]|uniref:Protoporphyrinogen IX dehydrogenase [quinone] n=1 Tax=Formosa sediminum TaxID=2594004 RepID=A0A516GQV7_9FLAO|nr:menaquinone-dependent protoporphyrinogen IX dehydrogenase [Formosa sediminum]QDO93912.1 menaquinone-dependent protoporphyrinogen IX dehydrogenase [Formosa sediminum]
MNNKVGIIYATTDGQTLKICQRIAEHLKNLGFCTDIIEISTVTDAVTKYSKLIIGASIRYGKHSDKVTAFIKTHHRALNQIDAAFFSVNLVARKSDKNRYNTNPYVIKYFKQLDWTPKITDVFAGTLDYKSYSFLDRIMIKLIMKMTGGPTSSTKPIEYTNWDRVKAFSVKISQI